MLVLSRKRNEELVIRDDIIVRILSIDGNKVRIGIDAPEDVKVFRGELVPPQISLAPDTTNEVSNDLPRQGPQAKAQ